MREIKFRAWDKENEQMHKEIEDLENNPNYIIFTTNDEMADEQPESFGDYLYSTRYEVMQYTGLKDIKGKDIYEGDILDGSYINPLTKKVVKKYYQVAYENGCYNAYAKNHPFGSTVLYFINTKSEVIGNIYENPELLEHGDD